VHLATAATAFALVFPAELPDKTFIASLVLGTRGRPTQVWLGVAAAFAVHVVIAVTAGGLFALLPHRVVEGVVAALFAAGAVWCFAVKEEEQERKGAGAAEAAMPSRRRVTVTAFMVIFAAEWGDLTQIVTAQLAARFRDPLSVAVGALVALWVVAAVAVAGGRGLMRVVPLTLVRRVTGLVLAGFALVGATATIRG
jgi:putative Ca2+/H+ antiporter (TMEM165/GDT1 family)